MTPIAEVILSDEIINYTLFALSNSHRTNVNQRDEYRVITKEGIRNKIAEGREAQLRGEFFDAEEVFARWEAELDADGTPH